MRWTADELGIDAKTLQVWVAIALASPMNIQPCDACARLQDSAEILKDAKGTYVAALAQVVNEFASAAAPPSEEQMASIADTIARHSNDGTYYAVAGNYLDALAEYVGVLSYEMGYSRGESVTLAADKYIARLAVGDNVGVAAFIANRLATRGE
jgi:hypothetical protein